MRFTIVFSCYFYEKLFTLLHAGRTILLSGFVEDFDTQIQEDFSKTKIAIFKVL